MELKYPWVILIGIPLLIILIIFKVKKDKKYKTGTKIANTQYVKKIPYYQKVLEKYKLVTMGLKIVCIITIVISLFLLARPIKVETSETQLHSRDIFICIDASTSVNVVTKDLAQSFKEMLDELDGERVGITIFNTTSVLLVPLTDDYDYVKDTLDTITKSIEEQEKYGVSEDYSYYYGQYLFSGTITGNEERGSSLIADGLGSCIYNFPDIDEQRSRIIIFVTDNVDMAEPGKEVLTLKEATELAKEKDINLFAIAPSEGEIEPNLWTTEEDIEEGRAELKKRVEAVGGKFYEHGSENTMDEILDAIDGTSKSLINIKKERKEIGIPEIPFILLIISITILFIMNKKVKI